MMFGPKVSKYLHHEPCPKCGSKDNLGVWDDGHKYCFGCAHYEKAERTLSNVERPQEPLGTAVSTYKSVINPTPNISLEAVIWLRKYGVTDKEVKEYNVEYDENRHYLVFPLGPNTLSCRTFGLDNSRPKSITFGPRDHRFTYGSSEPSKTLVIVEDCVSAIRVGRQFECLPLLGSDVNGMTLKWASERFDRILLWLDRDMATKSVQQASKATLFYGKETVAVITEKDPKEYSDMEITGILVNFLPMLRH